MVRNLDVRRLRKRLLMMLAGLILSYVISFGLSIFLIVDSGILEGRARFPIIAGIAALAVVLAFFHVRAQFRRYDYLVRITEGADDDQVS